jgi:hypothetical protein
MTFDPGSFALGILAGWVLSVVLAAISDFRRAARQVKK